MKTLKVPHYEQDGGSDCQAACAAMVLDYFTGRTDGEAPERLPALLDECSFGFRPESGRLPPAITGLVAMAIAKRGFAVDFYSKKPDGGGIEGLKFLKDRRWKFTQEDIEKYAKHAKQVLADASQAGVTVHKNSKSGMSADDVAIAIAAGKPVVAIVDLQVLKHWPKSANHAVVITGIDKTHVRINDPAEPTAHDKYDRDVFFTAHGTVETDYDAYIVTERNLIPPSRRESNG